MKDIHTHFDEWIAAALTHDLTPPEQETFHRHLEQNADARALYLEAQAMSTLLESTLSPQRPSPNFENRMVSVFRKKVEGKKLLWAELAKLWLLQPAIYLPTAALVLVGLATLGTHLTQEKLGDATALAANQETSGNGALSPETPNMDASAGFGTGYPALANRDTSMISRKLDEIVIPRVELHDVTIREALDFLKQRAVALDQTEADPTRKGINAVLKVSPEAPEAKARISLNLSDVPLRTAFEYVAKSANLKLKIEPFAVAMVPLSEVTDVLITKEYNVPPGFIASLGSASAGSQAPIAMRSNAKDFLVANGMQFPSGASANFITSSGKLIVKNTQANLAPLDTWMDASSGTVAHKDKTLLLQEGQAYLESGRYDLASKRYERVLAMDKTDLAARQGMEAITQARAKYSNYAYNETRSRMLTSVDNGWELPVRRFEVGASSITVSPASDESQYAGNNFTVFHKAGDGSIAMDGDQPFVNQDEFLKKGAAKAPLLGDIPIAGKLFNTSPALTQTAVSPAQVVASANGAGFYSQFTDANGKQFNHRAAGGSLATDAQQLASNKDLAKKPDEAASSAPRREDLKTLVDKTSAPPAVDPTIVDNRKLVRNASLDLEVKNYDSALDSITAIAAGNSGYVATKNSARLPNGKMSGTIVLKVLPERLDAALLQIRELGELKNQSLSTRDVTKEYFDTDARLRNARKMEDRLLELLGTMKGKISELLQVEKELARVREQIEQMQGELKVYDSLVQFATISISLREKDLNEAAAYLLKETVTLSLFSGDVEKTYESARREADGSKAQILQSRVVREDSGRVTAVMDLLVAPEDAESLIARVKGLGRVQNYNKQDERIAQDGSGSSNTAKVERDKVHLALSILPDDESRKEIRLVVQTKKVESAFEEAKSTAATQGATIVTSGLSLANGANGQSANLTVRTPGKNQADLLEAFRKLGLVSQFTVQRDDAGHTDPAEPVLITLALTNASQPMQLTRGAILTPEVEPQAAHLKQAAAASQGETVSSTFERLPDGTQVANLVFRLPLDKYPTFFEEAKKAGTMKDFTVQRQDRAEENPELATAEVALRLYSQSPVVAESNGLFPTLRHTLGQGAGALMWSVRMIGVAVAFLAPWVLALVVVIWLARRISRARKARASRP